MRHQCLSAYFFQACFVSAYYELGVHRNSPLTVTAPSAVANAFNVRIAAADVAGLTAPLTSEHFFVDSFDTRLEGKDAVSAAWKSFFELFPGYRDEVDNILESGQTVILAGRGHCSDARLDGPALWRALVRDGQVAEWHVYHDTPEARNALGLWTVPAICGDA